MLFRVSFLRSRRAQVIRTLAGHLALATVVFLAGRSAAYALSCKVVPTHDPSEAEKAYLDGKYDRAETLYQAQLQLKPNDPAFTVALVEVLLHEEKVKEADDLIQKAVAQNPQSVELQTSLGDVQYRAGTVWLAGSTSAQAMKIDSCYPKLRLLNARVLRINSLYESAAHEIAMAHKLDPHDPAIRLSWLETLPRKQRIAELESYLTTATGDDADDLKDLHKYLDFLKQQVAEPHKACHLVSSTASTSINFVQMMYDATHLEAYGLDVKINDSNARLQIDTGASGLLVSRSVANRAGLKKFAEGEVGGIGNEGAKAAYTAYADDIRIGGLEFRDCQVEVTEKRGALNNDGLIGMDVFSHFLVTLDYPMRKLLLDPLPPRPGDDPAAKAVLETSASSQEDDEADDATAASATTQSPGSTATAPPRPTGPRDRYIAPEMKDWTLVYRIGHNLLLPASLNDSRWKLFILDTGAFSTTITPAAAREVTKVHNGSDFEVSGISGKVEKTYTADRIMFKFAHVSQENRGVVAFDTPRISRDLGTEVSGFIGITTLGQMTVKIDYRDGLVNFHYDANRGYKYPSQLLQQ